jgi:hypothetical protein
MNNIFYGKELKYFYNYKDVFFKNNLRNKIENSVIVINNSLEFMGKFNYECYNFNGTNGSNVFKTIK